METALFNFIYKLSVLLITLQLIISLYFGNYDILQNWSFSMLCNLCIAYDFSNRRQRRNNFQSTISICAACILAVVTTAKLVYGVSKDIDTTQSNADCDPIEGKMGNIYYVYRAEGSCSTTDILPTIERVLNNHINNRNGCPSQCLTLDHKGAWVGYLALGTDQRAVSYATCNSSGTFAYCNSGGNYNLPLSGSGEIDS